MKNTHQNPDFRTIPLPPACAPLAAGLHLIPSRVRAIKLALDLARSGQRVVVEATGDAALIWDMLALHDGGPAIPFATVAAPRHVGPAAIDGIYFLFLPAWDAIEECRATQLAADRPDWPTIAAYDAGVFEEDE